MPIYEYECADCEHRFDVLVRRSDEPPQPCPKCGSTRVNKLLSAFAVSASDPTEHCQTCPSASDSCSGGTCATAGACPFSG